MQDSLTTKLHDTLAECLEQVEQEVEISPELLAHCAMKVLDPKGKAPSLVEWAANLELRQLARALLRKTFDPLAPKPDVGQEDMFVGLQEKYPCKRSGEVVYVDRMRLSHDERKYNISRLEKEGQSKLEHAGALRTETEELEEAGYFDKQA